MYWHPVYQPSCNLTNPSFASLTPSAPPNIVRPLSTHQGSSQPLERRWWHWLKRWSGPKPPNGGIKGLIEMTVREDQESCSLSRTEVLVFSLSIHSAHAERGIDEKNNKRPGG